MRALPAYAEAAAKTGEKVPSISVAAFEGWYDTLAARVAKTRGTAAAGSPSCAHTGPRASYARGSSWVFCCACRSVRTDDGTWYAAGKEPPLPAAAEVGEHDGEPPFEDEEGAA